MQPSRQSTHWSPKMTLGALLSPHPLPRPGVCAGSSHLQPDTLLQTELLPGLPPGSSTCSVTRQFSAYVQHGTPATVCRMHLPNVSAENIKLYPAFPT